jgi:hemolysin activation/secretion protein
MNRTISSIFLCALLACPWSATGEPLPPLEVTPEQQQRLSSGISVLVKAFRFEGNTAFTDQQLLQVIVVAADEQGSGPMLVRDYVGQSVDTEALEMIRVALTRHYIDAGYISSGAVLPDQAATDGIITYRIVEGQLTRINITGNKHLRSSYLTSRLARGSTDIVNIITLKNSLEVLRAKPLIRRINAQLKPGIAPGESMLDVSIKENDPLRIGVQFDNSGSPSVGAEHLSLRVEHDSLLGLGDSLMLKYGLISGGFEDTTFADADSLSAAYTLPIFDSDTTIGLAYVRSNTLVVEEPFAAIDIESESEEFALTLRHPLYQTASSVMAISVIGEHKQNQTFLLGRRFSLAPGANRGEQVVTVVRLAQEWSTWDTRRAFAARSTFSFGIDALDATNNKGDTPDSQFFAWLGQLQYVQRLGESNTRIVGRLNAQLTPDALLSQEQYALGGMDSVRGYRENQLVRHNAVALAVELRDPLWTDVNGHSVMELAPFYDFGYGWNVHDDVEQQHISSAGVGLLFDLGDKVTGRLYWGLPFRDFDNGPDHNLQDSGLHFTITAWGF